MWKTKMTDYAERVGILLPAIFQKMDTSMGLSSIATLSLGLSMSMAGAGRAVMRSLGPGHQQALQQFFPILPTMIQAERQQRTKPPSSGGGTKSSGGAGETSSSSKTSYSRRTTVPANLARIQSTSSSSRSTSPKKIVRIATEPNYKSSSTTADDIDDQYQTAGQCVQLVHRHIV